MIQYTVSYKQFLAPLPKVVYLGCSIYGTFLNVPAMLAMKYGNTSFL